MTFAELKVRLAEVKAVCPDGGISEERSRIHFTWQFDTELGLSVWKNGNGQFEVYPTQRGREHHLIGVFPTESDAYEYVHCYYKRELDRHRFFGGLISEFPKDMISRMRRRKIPASEYSFDGGIPKDCLCVGQNGDTWEVYYSDGAKKATCGTFCQQKDACDFLYYLVMKKYVKIKKRWW